MEKFYQIIQVKVRCCFLDCRKQNINSRQLPLPRVNVGEITLKENFYRLIPKKCRSI